MMEHLKKKLEKIGLTMNLNKTKIMTKIVARGLRDHVYLG